MKIDIRKNTLGSKFGRLRIYQLWKFKWNRRGTESKKQKNGGRNEKKSMLPQPGIEPGTCQ